jgi:hypothetical protein
MTTEHEPTLWGPARKRAAMTAITMATVTAALGAALGGSAGYLVSAVAAVCIALVALFRPTWIAVQVLFGQAMAAKLLVAPNGSPLRVLPIVAGVIATAELLSAVARLDAPGERDAPGALRSAGIAAALGATVFLAVALVDMLPGPTGLLAIGIASAACVVLAILLVRRHATPHPIVPFRYRRRGVEIPTAR